MALPFKRRRRKEPDEPREEAPPSEPEPEEAPARPESAQPPELGLVMAPALAEANESPVAADEPVVAEATQAEADDSPFAAEESAEAKTFHAEVDEPPVTASESLAAEPAQTEAAPPPDAEDEAAAVEAATHERAAPDPEKQPQTAENAPLFSSALRANADTVSLLNDLLRLHEAEDIATLSDAADQLARAHLNSTHLLAFLADKGGSFRLHAAETGTTGTLVKRLSEVLGVDVRTETPTPLRGKMAKMLLGENSGPQSAALADFWGATAGDGACWRAEKVLAISQVAAVRLASSEGPLGIALFLSLGDPPDPAMLDAIGRHLTAALVNLLSIEKARQFGTMDPVRWIPDRQEFAHQLSREVSRARRYGHPVSLILLVVDNYDALRFEYGWTVANRLLRSISGALSQHLRESDYLGSYNHNGFGIILVQTPSEAVPETAGRLSEAAQGVRVLEGDDGPAPKCLIATASSPEDGGDVSTVLLAGESRLLPKRSLSSTGV